MEVKKRSAREFEALMVLEPEQAKKEMVDCFVAMKAHRGDAGSALVIEGVNRNTFARWAEKLGLTPKLLQLEEKAIKEGWFHGKVGGRPSHVLPKKRGRKKSVTS